MSTPSADAGIAHAEHRSGGARGEPVIEIAGLRKVFRQGGQDLTVLDGIDLTIARGEIYGILGRSGAGKSTLIRCLNGLEQPTEGSVLVDGSQLRGLKGSALRAHRRRVGMVFQHFNLLGSRTALENVALPLELAGVGKAERRARAQELLELVDLHGHAGHHPAQLSGGQKQRVGIARALAGEPTVLLADEATSALDEATAGSVLELLQRLNRELALTVVLVTHQLSVVKRMCHAAAVLSEGRIVSQGALRDAVADPDSQLGALLLPALPDEGQPAEGELYDVVLVDDDARAALQPTGDGGRLRAAVASVPGLQLDVISAVYEAVDGRPVARLRIALHGAAGHAALGALRGHGIRIDPANAQEVAP